MKLKSSGERELREIAIAANCGEASDEQIARLEDLIRSDRQLASYAARLFDQQASLAWQGSHVNDQLSEERPHVSLPDSRHLTPDTSSEWAWPAIAVGIGF